MRLYAILLTLMLVFLGGCFSQHAVQVAPIQVAPIRVTMDVNVNVQDRHEGDEEGEDDASGQAAPNGEEGRDRPARTERVSRATPPSGG